MSEHVEHVHHDCDRVTDNAAALAAAGRLPKISWSAVFAGLVVTFGLAWLLHLLGVSIGVSVADATDTVSMSEGITGGVAIWIVLTWLIAFFVGSLAAARLAGTLDDVAGMLHGFTLWGAGVVTATIIGYMGVSSLLQTGQQLATAAVTGIGQAADTAGTTATSIGESAASAMDSQVADTIQNQLSDSAIEAAANMDEQLSESEIRKAIEDLDNRTLRRLTQDLTNNDQEGAAELLAQSTDLSQKDSEALVEGAYQELEEQFGNPDNEESLSEDLQDQMAKQVDGYVASLDAKGGAKVTAKDVRKSIDKLDSSDLYTIAMRLVNGDERGAKRALANGTNLSDEQIDEIYEGAAEGISQEIEAYKQELNETAETASTYAQSVLWVTFAASALALAVSLGGGWLGADSARRIYDETYEARV